MTFSSIGDLAHSLQLRRQNASLKMDLNRYSQELSSGISRDIGSKLRGNFNSLAGIERGIAAANSYSVGISERRLELSIAQQSLESLSSLSQISETLLVMQEGIAPNLIRNTGGDALSRFVSAVQTLNIQAGGRTVFGGVETDSPAVANAETMLLAIEAEIAIGSAATATEVATIVDDWFDTGGGFDFGGYLGGSAATAGVALSPTEVGRLQPTAEDTRIRSFLSALAKGALLGRDVSYLGYAEQGRLANISGEALVSANNEIVDLRASIGLSEAQVERASVEVGIELQALQLAKSELISVDPFETAVRLENAQTQLETLYSVTARLSRLSLANYL